MTKNIIKIILNISLITINIFALGYLYVESQQLKSRIVVAESEIIKPPTVAIDSKNIIIENLRTENVELSNRISKLEEISNQLGKTLQTCEIVPEAYQGFHASPGYETKLGMCTNSYSKLIKTLKND